MTFDPSTERWQDVGDDDVRWLATQGFNANEVAAIAHTSEHVAQLWVDSVFTRGAAA